MKKENVMGLLALCVALLSSPAFAVNTFGVDLSAITTDLGTVGTLVVALAVFWLGYKFVRKMLGR